MRGRRDGQVGREVKLGSEPECLVGYFARPEVPVKRIGLEAGPLSQWLYAALSAGHEVVLLETRHVKAALSAMTVKADRKEARGIAQLLRIGWYRPVHAKSSPAQDTRALLVGLELLQSKLLDVELSIGVSCAVGVDDGVEPPHPRTRTLESSSGSTVVAYCGASAIMCHMKCRARSPARSENWPSGIEQRLWLGL